MNPRNFSLICGLMLVMTAQAALAQPSTVVEHVSAPAGQSSVDVNVTFTPAAGNTNAAQFDINFDKTELSANIAAVCPALWVCSQTAGGIRLVSPFAPGGGLAGINIDVPFDLTLAVPNTTYPLALAGELYADSSNLPLASNGSSNGSIEILPAPEPSFSSNPTPAAGVTVPSVVQNATDTTANVVISNSGGAGSTLTGTCTETADPSGVFSLSGDTNFSVLQGSTDTVTVTCDSAGPIASHTGEMSCSHNGTTGLSNPQVYALSCTITAGPQPAYTSSNPIAGGAINLSVTEAGEPDPSQTLTITNTGDASTTLTGTCSMLGGSDPEIYLTTAGGFSIPQGAGGSEKIVACDASVQGNFSGTLSCSHNGSSPASPVNYAVSCVVPEAGAAVFASSPAPGAIDVDGGNDVVVGDDDPTSLLTFFNNADPGDQDLDISCTLTGDAQISVVPSPFSTSIGPQENASVTFSCDTAASGSFTASYECTYANGGVDAPAGDPVPAPNAIYNLSCEVRDPESQVVPNPPDGTPLNSTVDMGGTATFNVVFPEINDEGEDGSLDSCSLADGTNFVITSPVSFPQVIGSGTSVTVTVEGTDPGSVESFSDTLTCTFSDSDDTETSVSYPLNVTIGGDARITVLKDFTDDNPGEVTVDLDCNTGLILDQEKTISEDGIGVTFVITDFDAGELSCNVTERPVDGYSADFTASGDTADIDSIDDPDPEAGCYYNFINGGDENLCEIVNSPLPVDVVITKEWLYPGSSDASAISDYFELEMRCTNAEITDGYNCGFFGLDEVSGFIPVDFDSCLNLSGEGDTVFTVEVTPGDFPGGSCYVQETWTDPAVEVDNGCAGSGQGIFVLDVSAGSGDSCTITNTVFFEGIPTLNQYGMALMALLMLGMGFVAVRRVV